MSCPPIVWLAYMCETSPARVDKSELIAPVDAEHPMSELPLLAFRQAACLGVDAGAVEALLEREPRFAELSFFRGLVASGQRKLDDAEARYREAYAWRPTWPAATLAIANIAMTAEEFPEALEFYDKTLALAAVASGCPARQASCAHVSREARRSACRRGSAPRAPPLSRGRVLLARCQRTGDGSPRRGVDRHRGGRQGDGEQRCAQAGRHHRDAPEAAGRGAPEARDGPPAQSQ